MALSQKNALPLCFQNRNPLAPLLTDISSSSSTYISCALQGAKTNQGCKAEAVQVYIWHCFPSVLVCSTDVQSYTDLTSTSVQECGACSTAGLNTEKTHSLTAMSVWMELYVFHHRGDCSCYCISSNFEQKVIRKVMNWLTNSFFCCWCCPLLDFRVLLTETLELLFNWETAVV